MIKRIEPLGFPWRTPDPFLFCVYHDDRYPKGNEVMGPSASLSGRDLGQDFAGKDGWRMYHGREVPGFPQHPHRGFETVTIVRKGLIDHSDSLGATARFGNGDVQWLTAGRGILHAEMFPLLEREKDNPLELFQIWLNLPKKDKLVDPHFSMLWADTIPQLTAPGVHATIIAGALGATKPLAPPPKSWAAHAEADVAIWTIKLEPGAEWTLPPAREGSNRMLYFFAGDALTISGQKVARGHAIELTATAAVPLKNGGKTSELLLLQGRPIGEPVVQYGPFVMTSEAELRQTFLDYQRTQFGGWPWPSDEPVHARTEQRFAKHVDGRIERRG